MRLDEQSAGLREDGSTVDGFETLAHTNDTRPDLAEQLPSYEDHRHDGSHVNNLDPLIAEPSRQDSFSSSSTEIPSIERAADRARTVSHDTRGLERLSLEPHSPSREDNLGREIGAQPSASPAEHDRQAMSQNQARPIDQVDLDSVKYMLKTITFNGHERVIACQNTNGACPVLSIANFLSLSSLINLPKRKTQISAAELSDLLAELLIHGGGDLSVLEHLEDLHRGLNVNPSFTGVAHFEAGQEIISSFGAELVHGWIPGPSDLAFDALTSRDPSVTDDAQRPSLTNYEAAQMQILLQPDTQTSRDINGFLLEYPSNMTPTGLAQLQAHLKEGEMRILFYNSHFSLLHKHPQSGDLYTLVTDTGYLESGNHVVWESLVFHSPTQMYSADFIPRTILGESMEDNDYGMQGQHGGKSISSRNAEEEADAALARQLHAEERHRSDAAMARALQEQENQAAAATAAQREEAQQRRGTERPMPDHRQGQQRGSQPQQPERRRSSGVKTVDQRGSKGDQCRVM